MFDYCNGWLFVCFSFLKTKIKKLIRKSAVKNCSELLHLKFWKSVWKTFAVENMCVCFALWSLQSTTFSRKRVHHRALLLKHSCGDWLMKSSDYIVSLSRSFHWELFCKKLFLRFEITTKNCLISNKNSWKIPENNFIFGKVTGLQGARFLKRIFFRDIWKDFAYFLQ